MLPKLPQTCRSLYPDHIASQNVLKGLSGCLKHGNLAIVSVIITTHNGH